MDKTRRGFFKVLGAVASAAYLPTLYQEKNFQMADSYRDWIEDMGDFYIVRVPDLMTFSKVTLDKPTILQLGFRSVFSNCKIQGYTNVYNTGGEFKLIDNIFDASGIRLTKNRYPLEFKGKIRNSAVYQTHSPKGTTNMTTAVLIGNYFRT